MENFKNYVEKMVKAKSLKEFPVKKDFDYTVVFVQVEPNTAEGIYRTLLPSFYLNKYTTIRAFSVGMSDGFESISINEKKYTIKAALAKLADHIVLPFTSVRLDEPIIIEDDEYILIKDLKKINPKLKISYYIDYNYYLTPDSYPFVKEYTGIDMIANIEKNITLVDQVIVSNKALYNFLHLELSQKEHIKGCNTDICYQPTFYDKTLFPPLPDDSLRNRKARFGIVMNPHHFADLNFIKGILKEFLKKHSDEAEIVLLGWNGMHKEKNYLNSIEVEYHPPVPFYDYYQKLIDMRIDCFLIPIKNNKFNNSSRNINKMFDFARLNTPIIGPEIEPYKAIGIHNDNMVLCDTKDNWMFELETFLIDRDKYEGLADRMYNAILEREISEKENIKILMDLYQINP